jgi:hypothetical protein
VARSVTRIIQLRLGYTSVAEQLRLELQVINALRSIIERIVIIAICPNNAVK